MVVLWLGLSLNTICGRMIIGLSVSVSKHSKHIWSYYIGLVVLWLGLSLLSSVSKHNTWSYYGWVCRCCRLSVNTIYGRIMVGFVVVVVCQ